MTAAVARCSQAALDRRGIDATARTVEFDGRPTTSVLLEPTTPAPRRRRDRDRPVHDARRRESRRRRVRRTGDRAQPRRRTLRCRMGRTAGHRGTPRRRRRGRTAPGRPHRETRCSASDEWCTPFSTTGSRATQPTHRARGVRSSSPARCRPLAPWGLTVERSAFATVGGLPTDVGLDVAVAELCVALATRGRSALWTPAATLAVPEHRSSPDAGRLIGDDADRAEIDAELVRADARTSGRDRRAVRPGRALPSRRRGIRCVPPRRGALRAGEFDLVTSDVFDTIVTRPTSRPSDLFVQLGRTLATPGARDADGVRRRLDARPSVEPDSSDPTPGAAPCSPRRPTIDPEQLEQDPEVAAPECTLDEIWSLMPPDWVDRGVGGRRRTRPGGRSLRPIPDTIELFRIAHECGVPVVLVSDIYLSASRSVGRARTGRRRHEPRRRGRHLGRPPSRQGARAPRPGDRRSRCRPGSRGAHRRQRGRRRRNGRRPRARRRSTSTCRLANRHVTLPPEPLRGGPAPRHRSRHLGRRPRDARRGRPARARPVVPVRCRRRRPGAGGVQPVGVRLDRRARRDTHALHAPRRGDHRRTDAGDGAERATSPFRSTSRGGSRCAPPSSTARSTNCSTALARRADLTADHVAGRVRVRRRPCPSRSRCRPRRTRAAARCLHGAVSRRRTPLHDRRLRRRAAHPRGPLPPRTPPARR